MTLLEEVLEDLERAKQGLPAKRRRLPKRRPPPREPLYHYYSGQKFGRFVLVEEEPDGWWICRCLRCGRTLKMLTADLRLRRRDGRTCGCAEAQAKRIKELELEIKTVRKTT